MFNKEPSTNFEQKSSYNKFAKPNNRLVPSKDAKTLRKEGRNDLDAFLNGKSPSSNLRSNPSSP